MISPIDQKFRITQKFAERPEAYKRFGLRGHNGLDFGCPVGTPVVAVDDGTVAEVADDPKGYGLYIKLKHVWGESLYAHLSRRVVVAGGTITRGALLGLSGNTGNSTGPHLHFAVRFKPYNRKDGWGGFSDPLPHLEKDNSVAETQQPPRSTQPAQPAQPAQQGEPTMRLGKGAGPAGLNLQVIPFRERSDWNAGAMRADDLVWEAVDIFTTQNGSWDVNDGDRFGIDQWARDAYLYPPEHPLYYQGGGGERHIHVLVLGPTGERIDRAGVAFASDGPQWLQPPVDPDHITVQNTHLGWTDLPMSDSSTSHPPAPGPWWTVKLSAVSASDLVGNIGLPWNWHVATFLVFKATRWGDLQPVYTSLEQALHDEAQKRQLIQFNPSAALQVRAFADGYTINSPEFDVVFAGTAYRAQRAEHMGSGVVRCYYCEIPVWTAVRFIEW